MESFPPFYTLQPAESTRERQLALWTKLVLEQALKPGEQAVVLDLASFPAFVNAKLNRSMDLEGRRAVGEALVQSQNATWEDSTKTRLLLSRRTVDGWASVIYDWARESGRVGGAPSTVYEIYSGEDSQATELFNLHPDVCFSALKMLERQGKAVIIQGDTVDTTGVKFL